MNRYFMGLSYIVVFLFFIVSCSGCDDKKQSPSDTGNKYFKDIKFSDIKEIKVLYSPDDGKNDKKIEIPIKESRKKELFNYLKEANDYNWQMPKCANVDFVTFFLEIQLVNKKNFSFKIRFCCILQDIATENRLDCERCCDLLAHLYQLMFWNQDDN